MTIIADRVITYATLALLLWLPLPLGSHRTWSGMLFVFLVAVIAMLWAIFQFTATAPFHRTFKRAGPLFILLILCQFWVLLQWLLGISQDQGRTFYYLLLGCGYTLLYFIIVTTFTTRYKLTLLLSAIIIGGTLQGFYGAWMTLSGMEWGFFAKKIASSIGDATGTFINRNHFAGYLEMAIACGIGLLLALRTGDKMTLHNVIDLVMGPKAKIRLALVIMVIALVMSHSRMGNSAFFISLILVGALFVLRSKRHRVRNGLILISIIVIDVVVISQYFGLEQLKDRLLATQMTDEVVWVEKEKDSVPASAGAISSDIADDGVAKQATPPAVSEEMIIIKRASEFRDDVMFAALPLVKERPIVGHGAGSFESVYQRYPGPDIRLHFDHAHNDYLQFVIEFGAVGTFLLALFVLGSLFYAVQALWRSSPYRSGVGFAASMAIVSMLVHAVTDFNLQIPANAATFVVVCAIAVLAQAHSRPQKKSGIP